MPQSHKNNSNAEDGNRNSAGGLKNRLKAKRDLVKFDIAFDEAEIKKIQEDIRQLQEEIEQIAEFSNSEDRKEEEQYKYEKRRLISDETWCKIVGLLGTILIYALLLVVRLLVTIGLKGEVPSFQEVYQIA